MLTWIIDKHILKDSGYENMPELVQSAGYNCKISQYIPFSSDTKEIIGDAVEPIIPYGTVAFCRLLKSCAGMFYNEDNLRYHFYRSKLGLSKEKWINTNYVLMAYHQIKQNPFELFKIANEDYVFIRPDSGAKLFTGFCVSPSTITQELSYLDQMSGATDSSLLIVAPARKIYAEYRFIVINREVATGSLYIEHNQHGLEIQRPLDSSKNDTDAEELAKIVAACEWQPDYCYTCDIGITNDGPKIIELNSFSAAGFYKSDISKIVDKCSKLVLQLQSEDYVED